MRKKKCHSQGVKTSNYMWSLCEIPFDNVLPDKCVLFDYNNCSDIDYFKEHMEGAAKDLSTEGYGLSLVYYGNIDVVTKQKSRSSGVDDAN